MGECFLNRIIKTETAPPSVGYVRPTGVPNGEEIIANAPIIENGGVNYYPIYYMCLMDTFTSINFTKTGDGVSTGADAYVFSDEPETLYVGDTLHSFNSEEDFETSESWKCRYVIAYATEANKNNPSGININLSLYYTTFEFVGSEHLTLSNISQLFGSSVHANSTLRYVDLTSSFFYNNTPAYLFCQYCYTLETILLPPITTIAENFCRNCTALKAIFLPSVTTITGVGFCSNCAALETVSAPELESISAGIASSCASLKILSMPKLSSATSNITTGARSLKYFEFSNNLTSITGTSYANLDYTSYIKLPADFDIDGCNFQNAAGYTKSLAWFQHLATQLKDNSSGAVKTMTLGAANIALIPSETATIISNKNWTLN